MKKLILILIILVNCAFCKAQFTKILTTTTDPLGYITHLEVTWIVQGWNNYFLKSSDMYLTYQQLYMPTNPNYRNVIEEAEGKLFLSSSDLGTGNTLFFSSYDTGNSWQFKFETIGFYGSEFIMVDSLNGALFDSPNPSITTNDGGWTWTSNPAIGNGGPNVTEKYNDSIGLWAEMDSVYFTYNQFATIQASNCPNLLNPLGGFI